MTPVIRGPKDKSAFRDHPTEWTGYVDPLPACDLGEPFTEPRPSVSEVRKVWRTYVNPDWVAERVAERAWENRRAVASMERDVAVAELASAANDVRDAAAVRGQLIHDILERLTGGQELGVYDEASDAAPFVPAVQAFVRDVRPTVLASEVIVVGRRACGTLDGVVELPDGLRYAVDYKTRAKKAAQRSPSEGVQLGAYTSGDYWIVEDEDGAISRRMPLQVQAGLIVSFAPEGEYRVYEVDIHHARKLWACTVWWKRAQDNATDMFTLTDHHKRPKAIEAKVPARTVKHDFGGQAPTWTPPDEGGPVDLEKTKAGIKRAMGERGLDPGEGSATLQRWVREGDDAGRSWRITDAPTERRFTIYRGVVRLLAWSLGDTDARTALSIVLGEEVQSAMRVGMALGTLTIDEARRLIDVCDALNSGAGIRFDDDGRATLAEVA